MSNSCDDDDDDEDDETEDGFYSDFENEEACLSSSQSVKGKEERSYNFFVKLFEEDQELTKLYEEQCHVGKFECLVCSTIKQSSKTVPWPNQCCTTCKKNPEDQKKARASRFRSSYMYHFWVES